MSVMNWLVRKYVNSFEKEVNAIRYRSPELQAKELHNILTSPLVRAMHPQLANHPDAHTFFHQLPPQYYVDHAQKITHIKQHARRHKVRYFAQSSGTSGDRKLIPTTEHFLKINHLRGSWYILHRLYSHGGAKMNVFKGKNLLIGGSIYQRTRDYLVGDVSGLMLNRIPRFFRPFYVTSIATAISPDWESKIERTAQKASATRNVVMLGGVPTWVLALLRKVVSHIDDADLSTIWPHLSAYIHGGVSMKPYWAQFKALLPHHNLQFIEVYNATEGFFAYQDKPNTNGMLLMTKNGIYYEFIALKEYKKRGSKASIMPLHKVRKDTPYVMLISTQTGLLRYMLGDIVSFDSTSPYRLRVIGRTQSYINAFGEDLMREQAEKSLICTCQNHGAQFRHYTVAPVYQTIHAQGRHQWLIEFQIPPNDLNTFMNDLDQELQKVNINYAQKRANNIAMQCLEVIPLPKGSFSTYLKTQKRLGAQAKIPKLRNDRSVIERILKQIKV